MTRSVVLGCPELSSVVDTQQRLAMFSHIFISVSDFERALGFYSALMQALGLERRFCEPEKPWAGWHSAGGTRPLFVICKPFDGEPHRPGNGQMVAFAAESRHIVRLAHQAALAHGGLSEGLPGLRTHYHPHYFGAYFRDPDGNKLCVVCHTPEAEG
jgi:catechol 2,3-dioxygenase-like lactoylglutathione lyase family enzyme